MPKPSNHFGVTCSRGIALLELGLFLPLILFAAFVGLEFSRALSQSEAGSMLTREAANAIYRECTNLDTLPTATCLNGVAQNYGNLARQIVPGGEVLVSIYESVAQPDGTSLYLRRGMWPLSMRQGAGRYQSKIGISPASALDGVAGALAPGQLTGPINASVVQEQRVVVVAEVYLPFTAIVPFGSLFIPLENGAFYNALIM